MARILLVLSGSDHWTLADGTRHPTGFWAEEFVVAHRTFRDRGVEVQIATPGGVQPTVDQASLDAARLGDDQKAADLRRYLDSIKTELARPMSLDDAAARVGDYDAVYIPGGHAPMEDLPDCAPLGQVITELYDSRRVVAAVCHGPAGLLSANREDGSWLFAGRRLTAFTSEEERQVGFADRAPWLLETRLRERGARFEAGPAWAPHVVVDGNLVTGQNPASSQPTTDRTLDELHVGQRERRGGPHS
jgi:putative intracellular protease/amidase